MPLEENNTHWFLKDEKENVIDLVDWIDEPYDYSKGKPCAFMYTPKGVSKRAIILTDLLNLQK